MEMNANPLGKSVNAAIQALAVLYKECHKLYPDSPACAAIQDIMKAVSEVERQAVSGEAEAEGPAHEAAPGDIAEDMAEGEPISGPPALPAGPDGGPPVPAIQELGAPAGSMRDAAAGVKAAMLRAAGRRQNG